MPRAAKACLQCSQAKVKCSGGVYPCFQCTARGIDCTPPASYQVVPPKAGGGGNAGNMTRPSLDGVVHWQPAPASPMVPISPVSQGQGQENEQPNNQVATMPTTMVPALVVNNAMAVMGSLLDSMGPALSQCVTSIMQQGLYRPDRYKMMMDVVTDITRHKFNSALTCLRIALGGILNLGAQTEQRALGPFLGSKEYRSKQNEIRWDIVPQEVKHIFKNRNPTIVMVSLNGIQRIFCNKHWEDKFEGKAAVNDELARTHCMAPAIWARMLGDQADRYMHDICWLSFASGYEWSTAQPFRSEVTTMGREKMSVRVHPGLYISPDAKLLVSAMSLEPLEELKLEPPAVSPRTPPSIPLWPAPAPPSNPGFSHPQQHPQHPSHSQPYVQESSMDVAEPAPLELTGSSFSFKDFDIDALQDFVDSDLFEVDPPNLQEAQNSLLGSDIQMVGGDMDIGMCQETWMEPGGTSYAGQPAFAPHNMQANTQQMYSQGWNYAGPVHIPNGLH